MLVNFIENILAQFRPCFRREAAFHWFSVIVLGFMCRIDHAGVTSCLRALGIAAEKYESVLHFFRSSAFSLAQMKACWYKIVAHHPGLLRLNDRVVLIGDGTMVSKEGRYMPGVKRLHQESENSAKPQYIFGHMFGAVGAVIANASKVFCVPMDLSIQDGLRETAGWEGGDPEDAKSHVVQIVRSGFNIAETLGPAYLILDRYFLTKPAILELNRLNSKGEVKVDIITRAKHNAVAYKFPESEAGQRGRPRKRGDPVKLLTLFESRKNDFTEATVTIYGKEERMSYLCVNLLWGSELYQAMRFVLVIMDGHPTIFATTDISLDPILVIKTYAQRFKIECMFREMKQQVCAFGSHFWTAASPKLNRYRKKDEPDPLAAVTEKKDRQAILQTIDAYERFSVCGGIALGIAQMAALDTRISLQISRHRFLRTSTEGKVSEATILDYLRRNIFRVLLQSPRSELTRFIQANQEPDFCQYEEADIAA